MSTVRCEWKKRSGSPASPRNAGPAPRLEASSRPALAVLTLAPGRCICNCASRNRRARTRAARTGQAGRAGGSAGARPGDRGQGTGAGRRRTPGRSPMSPSHILRPPRRPGNARNRNLLKFAKSWPKSLESCSSLSERRAWPTGTGGGKRAVVVRAAGGGRTGPRHLSAPGSART